MSREPGVDARQELYAFMEQASSEMSAEYERVHARAAEDPGTAGDQGEENWAKLLRDWLPVGYHVETKGRVLGPFGTSPQVDVVVLSPSYPRSLIKKKLFLAAGAMAAFECKLTLRAEDIRGAVKNGAAVREVLGPRGGTPRTELQTSLFYGLLAHSHAWQGKNSTPVENVSHGLVASDRAYVKHPRQMLDVVCVADLGTWWPSKTHHRRSKPGSEEWWAARAARGLPDEDHLSVAYIGPIGESTQPEPKPVGVMFSALLRGLAWQDEQLRSLSEYLRFAGMHAPGRGSVREYRMLEAYSPPVAALLKAGDMDEEHGAWNEWS